MPSGPTILVVPPKALYKKLFSPAADDRLRCIGQVTANESEVDWNSDELARRIEGVDILVTSWRTPRITDAVLKRADRLKLVAHSAGSVKFMLDEKLFERGIKVSSAGAAMVQPVAEFTVLLCMLMLRPVHLSDQALRRGGTWPEMKAAGIGQELGSQTIGIVGVGQIGRRVVQMLRAWDIDVCVYDPYLGAEQAAAWGVNQVQTIDELMSRCSIVSLHAPVTPETHHLIGRKQLALLRDGSILVNTARSWLVDSDALAAELRAGRLRAAVDVYDTEPLPVDSPWRNMPNAITLPHIASTTSQCFIRQGDITVDEVECVANGQPLKYPVTAEMLPTMA